MESKAEKGMFSFIVMAVALWLLMVACSGCSSHGIEFRVGYVPLNSADIRQGFNGDLALKREQWKEDIRRR